MSKMIRNYAEVCKKFAADTADWYRLPDLSIILDRLKPLNYQRGAHHA